MTIYNPLLMLLEKLVIYIPSAITPNMITLLNFILINVLCMFALYKNPVIFSLCLFIYWIIDTLDGLHAKNSNQITKFGGILDESIDVYSILLITYMFIHLYLPHYSTIHLYKFILFILFLVDIPYLIHKYSSLPITRNNFLRTTDIILLLSIIPLFKYFTVSPLFINYLLKIFTFILFMYILILTIKLTLIPISIIDILLLLSLCGLYFIKNMTNNIEKIFLFATTIILSIFE